nr:MAG TPA: hypothetical protein [Caudoviricetes sp.]
MLIKYYFLNVKILMRLNIINLLKNIEKNVKNL